MTTYASLRRWARRHRMACVGGVLTLVAAGTPGHAQAQTSTKSSTKSSAKSSKSAAHSSAPSPSTLDGLYTDEQAARGKETYFSSCRSCHTPQSHTGATFNKLWRGKRLSDLFSFVSTRMPKNDPGSLADEDVADVVAFLLKMNAMPVGKEELYPSADSLKKYVILTKRSTSPTTSGTRKKP